ncbi:MAG: RimK/LysX family protein [Methylococcales bacterium]
MNSLVSFVTLRAALVLALIPLTLAAKPKTLNHYKPVMGWLESVRLDPWGMRVRAKLDTGAKTSSISAEELEIYEKKGKKRIRFVLPVPRKNKKTRRKLVDLPVIREVTIRQHGRANKIRPVVRMSFCLNGQRYKAQFTLTDRTDFHYPVLLGRRFLQDVALVDPAQIFLTRATCPKESADRD